MAARPERHDCVTPQNSPDTTNRSATILKAHDGLRDSLRRVARLARKELRESLRDRRTLATLIMMPLIVYPLLGSVVQKFAISRIDPNAPAANLFVDTRLIHEFGALFPTPVKPEDTEDVVKQNSTQTTSDASTKDVSEGSADPIESLTRQILSGQSPLNSAESAVSLEAHPLDDSVDAEELIRDGRVADVVLRLRPLTGDQVSAEKPMREIQILCRSNDAFSSKAAAEVERRVREFRDGAVRAYLATTRAGSSSMPLVTRVALESSGPKESPLSAFVPLMLVLMTMTGAVYPAIDLTAGERERGTLEMLIAAPVSRRSLLTAKFVAVFTVAVLTAIINLTAMILTLYGTGFDRVLLGDGATIGMFLQVLVLLVVFASFFSAVLLCITSFARSFREAQAWLIPLMLVSLAPGILSLMPGVRLTIGLSLIPLVNIVLLGKELFQGIAAAHLFVITLAATLTYTMFALRIAAQVFGSDTVLFGSHASVGGLGKRPTELIDVVPLKLGVGWLVVLAPAFVVLAGLRSHLVSPENLSGQLVLSGVLTIILFAVFPIALTAWNRIRFVSAFAVKTFSPIALLGSLLMGATLWALTYEVLLFGKGSLGWTQLLSNPKLQELAQRLTKDTPLLLRLLTLAAIPAVCEELFFRGFLMSALQDKSRGWKLPLFVSTFLFAAFHVVVDQTLTFERFPATFVLGLVLGWIRLSTGSIIPGIAMHALSNGLLLSLMDLEPLLARIGLSLAVENETHLPIWFLVSAFCLASLGAGLVRLTRRPLKDSGDVIAAAS